MLGLNIFRRRVCKYPSIRSERKYKKENSSFLHVVATLELLSQPWKPQVYLGKPHIYFSSYFIFEMHDYGKSLILFILKIFIQIFIIADYSIWNLDTPKFSSSKYFYFQPGYWM
jgi:hypothetical protein